MGDEFRPLNATEGPQRGHFHLHFRFDALALAKAPLQNFVAYATKFRLRPAGAKKFQSHHGRRIALSPTIFTIRPMFACPNCARALTRMQSAAGIFWGCDICGGRTVAIPILRKVVGDAPITRLWAQSRSAPEGQKRCPTCGKSMHETEAGGPRLDICKLCQFVWFDPREFEQMPAASPLASRRAELPQAAREAIAVYEAQRLGEMSTDEGPSETWQYVPAAFGLPVECDSPSMAGYPAVTWTIALVILVTSVVGFALGDLFIDRFAFVPAEALRYGGLTFITSFFLHGGILHLASNLYFLLTFGDNVEEYLGRIRFAALLLGATIAGGLFHTAG